VLGEILESERLLLAHHETEDAEALWESADCGMLRLPDAGGHEVLEGLSVWAQESHRRIARPGDLAGEFGDAVEHAIEREHRSQFEAGGQEAL
jgi:hypothetical protein